MQLHMVTVRLDGATGQLPSEPLSHLDGELISVGEYSFYVDGTPHLLLTAQVRPPRNPNESRPRRRGDAPKAGLTDEQRATFDRVRGWRKSRSEADGVPAFAILNNRQLRDLAVRHRRPAGGPGHREGQGGKEWGQELLTVLAGPPEVADA